MQDNAVLCLLLVLAVSRNEVPWCSGLLAVYVLLVVNLDVCQVTHMTVVVQSCAKLIVLHATSKRLCGIVISAQSM